MQEVAAITGLKYYIEKPPRQEYYVLLNDDGFRCNFTDLITAQDIMAELNKLHEANETLKRRLRRHHE